jgi:hypothetical protein
VLLDFICFRLVDRRIRAAFRDLTKARMRTRERHLGNGMVVPYLIHAGYHIFCVVVTEVWLISQNRVICDLVKQCVSM